MTFNNFVEQRHLNWHNFFIYESIVIKQALNVNESLLESKIALKPVNPIRQTYKQTKMLINIRLINIRKIIFSYIFSTHRSTILLKV